MLLFFSRLGDPLERVSFDLPFLFTPPVPAVDVVVVTMNERTYRNTELNGTNDYPVFDRATHARFVDKLKADGARVVVFDLFFADSDPMNGDAALAEAITNHGKVVLVAEVEESGNPEFPGTTTNKPLDIYVDLPGCIIAVPNVFPGVVRRFPPEGDYLPTVPFAAAVAAGARAEPNPSSPRWVAYYGDRNALPTEEYQSAIGRPPGYFANKVVFIGGKPEIDYMLGKADEFATAFTRRSDEMMRGVELQATMYLNLVRNEWLVRLPWWGELLLILGAGALFGWGATKFNPTKGAVVAIAEALVFSVIAIVVFWTFRTWMNWVLIAWVQAPVAWAAAALVHSRTVAEQKETLEEELESIKSNLPARQAEGQSGPMPGVLDNVRPAEGNAGTLVIPNYELLRVIGEGAFGQVWLARSLIGGFRSIKIVHRTEDRPFEREFAGVRNFGEISEMHPGWVKIFHVGKDDAGGFFYYVMETADDLTLGRAIDPARYTPKTLGRLVVEHRWLPVADCIEIGIKLADAIAALHRLELVHRDLKPSNIIFVNDSPKLADIGLVARAGGHKSVAGTMQFIPDEGMGTPQADIFSFGRLLYQIATGSEPAFFPGLPVTVNRRKDVRELMQLMEIINIACAPKEQDRFQSAVDLREELIHLQRRLYGKQK